MGDDMDFPTQEFMDRYNLLPFYATPGSGGTIFPCALYKKFYIIIGWRGITEQTIKTVTDYHKKIIDYIIDNYEYSIENNDYNMVNYCVIGKYGIENRVMSVHVLSDAGRTCINSFEEFAEFLNKNCHEQYMHKEIKIALKN
jgi:hypothetical protein